LVSHSVTDEEQAQRIWSPTKNEATRLSRWCDVPHPRPVVARHARHPFTSGFRSHGKPPTDVRLRCTLTWAKTVAAARRRHATGSWMLLEQVRWVVREGSDIMHPAIGSNINIHKSVPGLSELSSDQLKQLLAAISADRRASGSGSISPQLLKSLATVRCSSACAAGRQRGVWEAPWEAVEPAATR
jgi:hypothetical protein